MEPEGLLPCSQDPGLCPESDECRPHPHTVFL